MAVTTPGSVTATVDNEHVHLSWIDSVADDPATIDHYTIRLDSTADYQSNAAPNFDFALGDIPEGSHTFEVKAVATDLSESAYSSPVTLDVQFPKAVISFPNGSKGVAFTQLSDGRQAQKVALTASDDPLPVTMVGGSISVNVGFDGDDVQEARPLPVQPAKSPSSILVTYNVDDTAPVTIFESNPNRQGLMIHNHSDGQLFVSYSDTVSATVFTQVMLAHTYIQDMGAGIYTGEVTALRPDGEQEGPVMCTELTGGIV